jgi:hypothetical protein
MYPSEPNFAMRRFFSGIADPPMIDYVAELLTRFVHRDGVYRVRNLAGRRLGEVAQMLAEAEARVGEARRDVHRHIGDFTLFWTGVFPEALGRMQESARKDHLLDYTRQGKRSYRIASELAEADGAAEAPLFERLSREFELCAFGLGEVRKEWERRDDEGAPPAILF